ncbi:hypothetical protein K438DRAFT_2001417 [Mycena galopus ATCC 62051]|nr:hypothetical protein K438DRAFT_2001417 [Mycena galopus ATCC 62051]
MQHQPASEAMATMPTYRRTLSPNELSYFLPSRASGANDLFNQMTIHSPPSLISTPRLCIAWAILRLRHSLIACRVEMQPGRYDEAQFVFTPPSSPSQALAEATACVRFFDNMSGPELNRAFLCGPPSLSVDCLSRMDVARHMQVSPGIYEFGINVMFPHMISDGVTIQESIQTILELLGGSSSPGGPPRTDAELRQILEDEWTQRWGAQSHAHDAIASATEVRILGLVPSKLQQTLWKVDHQNIQKRFIGGHTFPRVKSPVTNFRFVKSQFDTSQTKAILAECKAKRVTLANMGFALCNFAWIRLCASHPEINAPKDLPMLMYTAINIRRYLKPASPLESRMSLALEYTNVVLPAFLPRDASSKTFWARGREAQRQLFRHAHSPLLLKRAVATGRVRAERAKAWACIDDAADGTLPPAPHAPTAAPAPPAPNSMPSLALIGYSDSGNWDQIYRPATYPLIKLIDVSGGTRRQPGGMLLYSWIFRGQLNFNLLWDEAGYPAGLVEEFRRYLVDGVHEYVLKDPSLKGTAREVDCLAVEPVKVKGKL